MSMQKAVVTSNIGWATEIIENNITGCMVNTANHHEASEKIDQLLENDDKRNEMGVSARNHILENFSVETIVARNLEFYKKICH